MVCSLNSWIASTDRTAAGVPSDVSMLAVPSIMKLFDVGRAPMMLIALPTPCRMPPCSPPVSTAPAPRNSNCRKLRPLSGSSVTCFSRDRVADRGAAGIERERGRLHFDGLGHVAGVERHVDPLNLVDGERDVRMNGRLESGLLAGDDVDADREQRDDVVPVVAGFRLTGEPCLLIGHDHFHAGHHRPGRVAHRPGDLTGGRLSHDAVGMLTNAANNALANTPCEVLLMTEVLSVPWLGEDGGFSRP